MLIIISANIVLYSSIIFASPNNILEKNYFESWFTVFLTNNKRNKSVDFISLTEYEASFQIIQNKIDYPFSYEIDNNKNCVLGSS